MERKSLIIGLILIVAGLAGRYSPRVVTGISFWSIAELAGVVLVARALFLRREALRSWIKGAPLGRPVGLFCLLLVLALCLDLTFGIAGEVQTGQRYDLVAADLEKDDPVAAISLARHYHGETSGPLRERIVVRIGELGNTSPRVTGTLREAVRNDPDRSVRAAAAESLGRLMTPADVLKAVIDLPGLPPESRAVFVGILARRTGKDFGDDAKRWFTWVTSSWAGEKGDAAWQLALTAWDASADQPSIRDACLLRLEDPDGVSEQTLASTLRHQSPQVRGAAAKAMGRTHSDRWRTALQSALKSESDDVAAMGMAAAMLDRDQDRAGLALIEAARTATHESGRNAALSALAGKFPAAAGKELPDFVHAVRKTLPAGPERRKALDLLVLLADGPGSALLHLKSILNDRSEDSLDRGRALDGILGVAGEELPDDDLVQLLADSPNPDFSQKIRGELKRRTGQDGGRDAEAWRRILKEAEAEEE
jgi:hypothetical protein